MKRVLLDSKIYLKLQNREIKRRKIFKKEMENIFKMLKHGRWSKKV